MPTRTTLRTLLPALFALPALAQWSTQPALNNAIADKLGEQITPKVAATDDGGCYIGWFDNSAGSYAVWLQHLDAAGNESWAHNGIKISDHPQDTSLVDWDLIADSAGNCVLVFTDKRDGGDLDVFAYRVSPSGAQLWGPDGVQLSFNSDYEPAPRVCETSDGQFAFAWARLPAVVDGGIVLQRLTAAGTPVLPLGGLTIVTVPGEDPAFCQIAAAENGNVIVSWIRSIATFASPRHLRARKFAPNGAPVWAGVVNVFDALSLPIAHQPGLKSDGSGGALLWWHRATPAGDFDSFVQNLDTAGNELFPHNGLSVATSAGRNQIDPTLAYPTPGGDLYVFWNERNTNQSQWAIYGQRISAAGALLWGSAGLPLTPLDAFFKGPPRSAAVAGEAVAFWYDEPTQQFGINRALAQRVAANASFPWGATPLVVSSVASTKSRLPVAVDCAGVAKVVWEDNRNGTPDVYAQSVRPDGALGAVTSAWTDLGQGLAGTQGVPQLDGIGLLCPGKPVTLALSNARPNALATLVLGGTAVNLPIFGGTLVPLPQVLIGGIATDASGAGAFAQNWPLGIPAGVPLYYQMWQLDPLGAQGFAASNGLQSITP